MLDINLFREDKGHNPELVRVSQRRRYADVDVVDQIIALDKEWRRRQFEVENLRKEFNKINKQVAQLKIAKKDASDMIAKTEQIKQSIAAKELEVKETWEPLKCKLQTVGNLVHDTVPISDDEANNPVIRSWGERRLEPNLKNHVELVELLGIADLKKGAVVGGGRSFYLKGDGLHLNQALINLGLHFLQEEKGYTAIQPPFIIRKEIMAACAQLTQFDEELYKVTGAGDDKYLIATSEQPLAAYHVDEWIHPSELPTRYSGFSSCFRKEAGSHGQDTLGIFRVHQFEKVEQFCMTSPNGDESWKMFEEMIKNSQDFYEMLKLPHQVVEIVSGALNDSAAKKYDLEGWFPASQTYRELVSCSNCTDYQSRKLEIRYGQKKSNEQVKQYVHLLNSTLTATERTMCCILENYQQEDGVKVPEALQPFMWGKTFLPFKRKPGVGNKGKSPKASLGIEVAGSSRQTSCTVSCRKAIPVMEEPPFPPRDFVNDGPGWLTVQRERCSKRNAVHLPHMIPKEPAWRLHEDHDLFDDADAKKMAPHLWSRMNTITFQSLMDQFPHSEMAANHLLSLLDQAFSIGRFLREVLLRQSDIQTNSEEGVSQVNAVIARLILRIKYYVQLLTQQKFAQEEMVKTRAEVLKDLETLQTGKPAEYVGAEAQLLKAVDDRFQELCRDDLDKNFLLKEKADGLIMQLVQDLSNLEIKSRT